MIEFKIWNRKQKRFHALLAESKQWNHLIQFGKRGKFWCFDGEGKLQATEKDSYLIQFTGLKDTKGKKIFVGDIVKYWLPLLDGMEKEEHIEKVVFEDGCYNVDGAPLYATLDWKVKVIGNIYENPELLKAAISG